VLLIVDDQAAETVDLGGLARQQRGGSVELRQDRRAGDAVAGAEPGAIVDRGVGPDGSQRDRLMPRQRCRRCVWRSSSGATTWGASSSLPRRWVVERPFSWFGRNRRLAKDFENFTETLATFVTFASIQLALRRLVRA
jgi:hypothetical protein